MTAERESAIEAVLVAWQSKRFSSNLQEKAEAALDALLSLPDPVRDAAREADDLLRRLSEWDMLYVSPEGKPVTADGPYWQGEIARARDRLRAALNEEP